MNQFKFQIGNHVAQSLTGFRGQITGRAEYVHSGNRYQVTSFGTAERPGESKWLDEGELVAWEFSDAVGSGN
jgi:hypothetical protein